ncbi:MAG: cache domain-containing protein [Rhodospirillales bacterium]|nr:cache domain-containing protein [Rhodospirillales bacterium]
MRVPLMWSKLFFRAFSVILAVVVVFSVSIYLITTGIIDDTVDQIEETSGWTILDNVYELVSQTASELEAIERTALEEKKRNLKTAVDLGEAFVKLKLQDVKEGRLTPAQARGQFLSGLRQFRFGNNDYVWISDYQSRLISHPSDELHDKDASQLADVHGNPIVTPMVEGAQAYGDGYYVYWWKSLGQTEIREKLTYYKNMADLKMVIGAGFFLDDLKKVMETRKTEALRRLRDQLSNIKLANTGYLYIFDGQNRMVIHPNPNVDGTDAGGLLEPVTNIPILKQLKSVADNKVGLRYKWDKPNDPGNYVYDKISWVRYFPKYDWYVASSVYTDELRSGSKAIGQRVMEISVLFLLISSLLGYLFVSSLTKPIIHLSKMAKQVRDGDLSVSSDIRQADEIGDLALAFNDMVDRLREDIEHLDSRVMARTIELREANEKLKEIDKMKSDFMTSVSHEFRTPLTSIRGFLAIIRREFDKHFAPFAKDDATLLRKRKHIDEDIDIIERESVRLTDLINDVLDYTDLISGSSVWRETVFNAREMIEEAIEGIRGDLGAKPGVELVLVCPTELPLLYCDKSRMTLVLQNILENAVKFTEDGAITLKAWVELPSKLFVSVQDSGLGIPPDQLKWIFSHFHQVLNADALVDKPRGTGLGLAICKQIVDHYGGVISVNSVLGQGATFTISLESYQNDTVE